MPLGNKKAGITGSFGKQGENSPYFLGLLREGLIPANAPNVFHPGIDFAADPNTPVYAVADGVVIEAATNIVYGKYVVIDIGDDRAVLYAHLNDAFVSVGQAIGCGVPIGFSGATGRTLTGPHLHFELRLKDQPINPIPFIRRAQAAALPVWAQAPS
jgi:murein DD-endopeptidase MepM/ murein hydrolase activator NlpD